MNEKAPDVEWDVDAIDALAQEIRRVDGNHSLGAGALAEALWPYVRALRQGGGEAVVERVALAIYGERFGFAPEVVAQRWAENCQRPDYYRGLARAALTPAASEEPTC